MRTRDQTADSAPAQSESSTAESDEAGGRTAGSPSSDTGGSSVNRADPGAAPTEGPAPETDADTDNAERPPALVVDGLSKTFGSGADAVTAVDDVSFAVESGSVVGLLGPNGAGKTTTIKSILGMILPDEGRVEICGVDVHEQPRRAYAHVDAMLEGARNDYWRLTVRENLRYFATIGGVDPDSVSDRHERLLDQLDLQEQADEPVRSLSRGMKQKVSLASVLATDASVVFLDEPTLGLDVESSLTLRRELRRIVADRDMTVILSSHDLDVIEDVCDRVIIVRDGRVIADDAVETLLRDGSTTRVQITSQDLDEHVRERIRGRFGLTADAIERDRPTVTVPVEGDDIYDLMALLSTENVTIERIETARADLEDVFLGLTNGGEHGR